MDYEKNKKFLDSKSIIAVSLPSTLFYVVLMFLSFRFSFLGMFDISQVLILLFFASILIQIIYTKFLLDKYDHIYSNILSKTESLLQEQEKIAKMLIRRDLELTRVNEELRSLDKMKSEFIGIVAHQLRTPLSGIKWTISMILNGDIKDKMEQKAFLMKTYESNDRMITLVNDMLLADRIEGLREIYHFTPTRITNILDSVLFEALSQINKKNISVHMNNLKNDLPLVNVDSIKIRAVFQNLLENAIKYVKDNGEIILDFSVIGKNIQFSIKDDGIGIPKDQQINIFNRFFRGENAKRVVADGSGLGLFVVRSIIEAHKGKIWFESEQDKGTVFYFTLPIS